MLYEPNHRLKKIIIIGAVAIALAVLVIVIVPLFYGSKTTQPPVANLSPQAKIEQEKIKKEQDKLVEMAKQQKDSLLSPEQLQKDTNRLIEEAEQNENIKSQEKLQKDAGILIDSTKK